MLEFPAAVGTGRVVASIVIGAIVIIAIFGVTLRMYRSTKGPEPMVTPITRKGRGRMNRSYAKHGWAQPFDDQGNLIPRSERKEPGS